MSAIPSAPIVPFHPKSLDELEQWLKQSDTASRIIPVGSRSKPWTRRWCQDATPIVMDAVQGVIDYQPSDFTITVAAGTKLADLVRELERCGQFFPFDPIGVEKGATIGGCVASGINGSCKQLWGGLRDFILAIEFLDSRGTRLRAGAKVVKNTAGFDLPKFFVGSFGQFGILSEITLKVFPRPLGWETVRIDLSSLSHCLELLHRIGRQPLDIAAIDFDAGASKTIPLWIRLVGSESMRQGTLQWLRDTLAQLDRTVAMDRLEDAEDQLFWATRNAQPWTEEAQYPIVYRIVCSPSQIPGLEKVLSSSNGYRRYVHAGNSCWIHLPSIEQLTKLESYCNDNAIDGMAIVAPHQAPIRIGADHSKAYRIRIQSALDPSQRYLPT